MKLKSPKLPAKGKCRVMYLHPETPTWTECITPDRGPTWRKGIPVAVASLSPEAVEARVIEGAKAIAAADGWSDNWGRFETLTAEALTHSRAVLASAGLLAGGKKGAK